jgi:propionate CoA-transferase
MSKHYYLTTTRYATSAFARLKMKEALSKRGLQPHVFERREAAETFLQVVADEEKARQ